MCNQDWIQTHQSSGMLLIDRLWVTWIYCTSLKWRELSVAWLNIKGMSDDAQSLKQRLRGLLVFNETSNMGCLLVYKQAFSGHTQGKNTFHTESVSEIIQQMTTRKSSRRRNLMSHLTMLYLHFLVFSNNNKRRDTQRNRRRCLVTYKEISS